MKIEVKEIHSKADLKKFIQFQLNLYKDSPYFVPSLISEELKSLDRDLNPSFEYAHPRYFLAYKGKEIVGRIASIINTIEVNKQQLKKLRFGYFDVINDINVSRALFSKLDEIARENQLLFLEGPMGATNLDKAGMLSFGFDEIATVVGDYNYQYYVEHLEKLGFETEKEWVEMFLEVPEAIADKIYQFAELVSKRYDLKLVALKSSKDLFPYIKPVFELLEESYQDLETFVPLTENQKVFYAKKYSTLLNPEYINLIEDKEGKLCAFAITMPSLAKALQKAKGKLFPWGWYHLLKAQKKNDTAEFLLIGVHPSYQRKGVTAIIFKEMFESFKKHNIKFLETNPELIENQSVQSLWKDYNPRLHKRRKTFKRRVK